jgi:hypothetical protein
MLNFARNTAIALTLMGAAALMLVAGFAVAQQPAPAKGKPPALSESQTQARAILTRMAEYLAGTQAFSVSMRAGYDAVQKSGQTIEFGEMRKITVSRPDRLRVEGEDSDGDKTLTVFTGKEIVLINSTDNAYAIAPQPAGLDNGIVHFVRDLGMRLPLAMMLVSQLPAELKARVRSVDYVEKTSLYGAPAHHLAARTDTVDFQVWVADGDKPLPQRVVITYKKDKGQPQFRALLSDWNLAPAVTDAIFAAKPPAGATKIAFATQLPPKTAPAARKPAAEKGAKQ